MTTQILSFNQGARVLIVDDEPLVLDVLDSALLTSGLEVTTASDTQSALYHLERTTFDAIISDVHLDHLDAFDLLFLARRRSPDIIPIFITGAPALEDAEKAKSMGALYLSKPIGISNLVNTLLNALEAREVETVELNDYDNDRMRAVAH